MTGVTLRLASAADADAILAIYTPVIIETPISMEEVPPSVEEIAQRITTTLETHPFLVAELEGRVVGYGYTSQHRTRAGYRWSCDITIYVDESARRQGVARALYDAVIDITRELGFRTAFAGIALPNEASVALHESFGFRRFATYRDVAFKFGRWHDVGWWELTLGKGRAPDEPIPFPKLNSPFARSASVTENFPITFYHNPACGTSRNALAMVQAAGYAPTVVEYLQTGWTRPQLERLIADMNVRPRNIMREKGTPAAELGLVDPSVDDDQIIAAMIEHPILVNRPIVETPRGTRLCRPSEAVLALLDRQPASFTKEDGEVVTIAAPQP